MTEELVGSGQQHAGPGWIQGPGAKDWSPYAGGIVLGLLLLLTYYLMGSGLGASGAFDRVTAVFSHGIAPAWTEQNPYFGKFYADGTNPLNAWLVYEVIGVAVGGLLGALTAGRLRRDVVRGASVGVSRRIAFAFAGGAILGLATRFGRGCTSGQALTGGSVLSVGSWAFMFAVFAGGYAVAYFLRKEWR